MAIETPDEFDAYTTAVMKALTDFQHIVINISKHMNASEDDFIKVIAAVGQALLFSTIKVFDFKEEYIGFLDNVFEALKRQTNKFKSDKYTVQ